MVSTTTDGSVILHFQKYFFVLCTIQSMHHLSEYIHNMLYNYLVTVFAMSDNFASFSNFSN
jgi:hypothetical protein